MSYSIFTGKGEQIFFLNAKVSTDNIVTYIMGSSNGGWASIGTGSEMAGSNMFVATTEGGRCTVTKYQATGHQTPKQAIGGANPSVIDMPTDAPKVDAKFRCAFTFPKNDAFFNASVGNSNYIWAVGQSQNFAEHGSQGQFEKKNILEGSASSSGPRAIINSTPDEYNRILFAHGILFFLAWAVAPFIGIFIARYLKDVLGVWWYRLHLGIMFGFTGIASLIGLLLIVLYKKSEHLKSYHEIGVAVCSVMIVQIILGFVSDKMWSPDRKSIPWWDKAHWWLGRAVFLLGLVNIYFGIEEFHDSLRISNSNSVLITYGVIVGMGFIALIYGQFAYGQIHHLNEDDDDYSMKFK